MTLKDQWSTSVFDSSPVFKELYSLTQHFNEFENWPTLDEYADLFKKYNVDITPVAQSNTFASFEDQYEPRVFLKKELQTRTHNWHDFFNALIWLKFPKTKLTLNKLHYLQASKRPKGTNRSKIENRITLFDECGAIIISNKPYLLELVRHHQWHQLFIEQKKQFAENFRCIIFGHAIFEKALNPYIGITCQCLILHDNELLEAIKHGNTGPLDLQLADLWKNKISLDPVKFNPLPLLGIPGYWPDQDHAFYDNALYFR